MRSVKSSVGSTEECGMDELQRSTWLLSTPVTAEVNETIQEFTGVKYQTNDQHKNLSLSRIQKDDQNAQKMF